MPNDVAISVENLSKRYLISHQRATGDGLRHVLQEKLTAPFRNLLKSGKRKAESGNDSDVSSQLSASSSSTEEFWALKDVSFEIKRGEVVGVIGRNGAGKSTLLKILSRITEPTCGRIIIEGRVASLLEVGTGFHPELTGRENIFLNGAILGMSRVEIQGKFDEIVAFAEIERFLDTPVKRYSSGMYVRLAFAVAAHLEPQILVVDEVLAVGDATFQKKCLGKMSSVAKTEGRTVLFVSHIMPSLGAICQSSVVLDSGGVKFRGGIREGISHYLANLNAGRSRVEFQSAADCDVRFTSVAVLDSEGNPMEVLSLAKPIRIRIEYEIPRSLDRVQIVCHLWSIQRVHVFATADIDDHPELLERREAGQYVAEVTIPPSLLGPGNYQVTVACGVPNLRLIDDKEGPSFEVSAMHSHAAQWSGARQDVIVALPMDWKTIRQ